MAKPKKRQDGDSSASGLAVAPGTNDNHDNNGNGSYDTLNPERISMRAYELYLARGGSDGQDWDDWLAAERELTQGSPIPSRGDSGE